MIIRAVDLSPGAGPEPAQTAPPAAAWPGAGQVPQQSEDSDNFDDFAALRPGSRQPEFPDFDDDDDEEDDIAARLGWGDERDKSQDRKPFNKYYLFAGAGAVVILVVVAVIMLLQSDPPELSTTPHMPPTVDESSAPAQPTAHINLKEPDIRGDKVVLTWTSDPKKLDFFVVVTKGTDGGDTVNAHRNHTLTVPIDAVSPYCFQVQATNGQGVFYSQTRAIRGSLCHD